MVPLEGSVSVSGFGDQSSFGGSLRDLCYKGFLMVLVWSMKETWLFK